MNKINEQFIAVDSLRNTKPNYWERFKEISMFDEKTESNQSSYINSIYQVSKTIGWIQRLLFSNRVA